MHTRSSIESAIAEVLKEVQQLCGHIPTSITPDTIPIFHLPDFDSQVGLEATTILTRKLEVVTQFEGKAANLFISNDGTRARKVSEIATATMKILGISE